MQGVITTVMLPTEEKGKAGMLEQLKGIYAAAAAGAPAELRFTAEGTSYVRSFRPAERLILLGCGHIGQALCRYAATWAFR